MLKNLSNLGKQLTQIEQKEIQGGRRPVGLTEACFQDSNIPCIEQNGGTECLLNETCQYYSGTVPSYTCQCA